MCPALDAVFLGYLKWCIFRQHKWKADHSHLLCVCHWQNLFSGSLGEQELWPASVVSRNAFELVWMAVRGSDPGRKRSAPRGPVFSLCLSASIWSLRINEFQRTLQVCNDLCGLHSVSWNAGLWHDLRAAKYTKKQALVHWSEMHLAFPEVPVW